MAPTRDSILKEYRDQILEGMARTLWVSAYADYADENPDDESITRPSGPKRDWDDAAPETPKAAMKAALELAKLYESGQGGKPGSGDLVELYGMAQTADLEEDFEFTSDNAQPLLKSDTKSRAERDDHRWKMDDANLFGSSLAWMAMDSGVSWFDDHKEFELVQPHFECHYDGEDLVWSGGLDDVREVSGKLGKLVIVNAGDSDGWMRTHAYVFQFEGTLLMAYGDHLVTALEECIGWIADNEPFRLMNDQVAQEYQTAITDGLSEDAAIQQAETDTTQDGQGNYISSDWTIVAEDPSEEQLMEIAGRKKNPQRNGDRIRSVDCSAAYHNQLKADAEKWLTLEKKGVQHIDADEEGPAEDLELRDCDRCPSTLAKRITLTPNPRGLTAKGERMYEDIKRSYQAKHDPRAKEIASRTVLARARGGATGLTKNAGVAQRGRVPLSKDDLDLIGAESGYHDVTANEWVTQERGPGGKLVTVHRKLQSNPLDRLASQKAKAKTARKALDARKAAGFEGGCDDPTCPGWAVFETGRGMGVEVCDMCNSEAKRQGLPVLHDDEVKHLPEAARELRRQMRGT